MSHRRIARLTLFGALSAIAGFTLTQDARAELPLRVFFRADFPFGNASLDVRGVFREDGARMLVRGENLPMPSSGSFDVVVSAGDANIIAASIAPDEAGSISKMEGDGADLRAVALGLDKITLYDGDQVIAVLEGIHSAAHTRFRGDIRFEQGMHMRTVTVAGKAGRRLDGSASYLLKISTGVLKPGEYVVRVNCSNFSYEIPFTVSDPYTRRHLTRAGDEDRVLEFSSLTSVTLLKDGEEIGSAELTHPH